MSAIRSNYNAGFDGGTIREMRRRTCLACLDTLASLAKDNPVFQATQQDPPQRSAVCLSTWLAGEAQAEISGISLRTKHGSGPGMACDHNDFENNATEKTAGGR
jgi:hypothetical protein